MKRLIPLLITLLLCSGCSSAIYNGGRFHDVLKLGSRKTQIRSALGEPVQSGAETHFGSSTFDDFVLRDPIYDSSRATGASMGAAMTFCLSEFIAFPQALWWSLTDRGYKRVRVLYSENSHYRLHFV